MSIANFETDLIKQVFPVHSNQILQNCEKNNKTVVNYDQMRKGLLVYIALKKRKSLTKVYEMDNI
jgi:hypothetical protein